MSVNKVKANYAEIRGDYVHIVEAPMRFFWFIFGCAIGFATAFMLNPSLVEHYKFTPEQSFIYFLLLTLLLGIIFVLFAGKNIEYQIPRSDVLVIKRYIMDRKVTVVFDDQRMKGLFLSPNEI